MNINGIYTDPKNNRLFLCGWEDKDKYVDVYAVDMTTGIVSEHYDGPSAKVDGMARDNCGNYYLSFWSENKVFKFSSNQFDNPVLIKSAIDGLSGPADIGIDNVNNHLLIPNLNNSTITIVSLDEYCNTSKLEVETENKTACFFPNPSKGEIHWNKDLNLHTIEIYSLDGTLLQKSCNQANKCYMNLPNIDNKVLIVRGYLCDNSWVEHKVCLISL